VVLAGLMARELGGGRFAQGLASLAVLVAPNFLVFGTFISMDAFDHLFHDLPVYVCQNPKLPFEEAWPRFKHYG